MNIQTLLYDEIEEEFEKLRKIDYGSEQYKVTVDGLTKLMDRAIEMEKFVNKPSSHDCSESTFLLELQRHLSAPNSNEQRQDNTGPANNVLDQPILLIVC